MDRFIEQLRQRTQASHVRAERSGIIRDLLKGEASVFGFALLQRNLLPAYQALEAALERCHNAPGVRSIFRRALYRETALERDLVSLNGEHWREHLPLLPSATDYAARIAVVAGQGNGEGLIAHAYVRYFGDLSGGQILRRLLAQSLQVDIAALSFYDFPDIADPTSFKAEYRDAFEQAFQNIPDVEIVMSEAVTAFDLNIAVSEAVQAVAARHEAADFVAS